MGGVTDAAHALLTLPSTIVHRCISERKCRFGWIYAWEL